MTASAARLFDIDCRLGYTLTQPTDFLFQIHALEGLDQTIRSESLQIRPAIAPHVYEDPTVGHRFMRLRAEAGPLSLRYRARVEVMRPPPNQRAKEMPIADLPDDLMHNLMPTRYCESDLLGSAATKLF